MYDKPDAFNKSINSKICRLSQQLITFSHLRCHNLINFSLVVLCIQYLLFQQLQYSPFTDIDLLTISHLELRSRFMYH